MPSSAHDPAGERREPGTRRRPDPDATGPRWAHPGAEGVAVPPAAAPAELATSHLPPALRTMTGRHWLVPVLAGLGGYAATVLSTVVALAVALLGLAVSGDSSTDSAAGGLPPELDSAADSGGPWTVIGVPFQLAAMAVLSPLRVLIDLGGEALAMSAVLPQYFALTCGVATAWLLTRGLGARLRIEHRGVQWTMAVLAGLTWAVVALAVTALTAVRADVPVFFTTLRVVVTGAGATLVVVSLLVGALTVAAALNGRVTQPAPGRLVTSIERAAPGLLRAARPVAVHAVAFGVLAAVAIVSYAFVQGGALLGLSALLWLPVATGWLFVLAHLSALTMTGGAGRFTDVSGSSGAAYLWSNGTLPLWAVLLFVLLALVAVVCAALSWAHVRAMDERVARTAQSWMVLPGVYFVLGVLVVWLLRVAGNLGGGLLGAGDGLLVLRPAGWTCVVFLVWGLVIELLARFVAPALMGALPGGVTRALRGPDRARGRTAVVASAASLGTGDAGTTRHPGGDVPAPGSHDAARPEAPDTTRVLPAYGAGTGEQVPASARREPMDPARKKRVRLLVLVVGAVVLLAVLAAVVFSVLGRTAFGPEKRAEEFLGAVTGGDVGHSTELADPNVNTERRALLEDAVYEAADNRVSSYSVTDTTVTGDTATVTAAVTQDNVTTPVTLGLVSDGRDGLFRSWRIEDSGESLYRTVSVEVPAGVGELSVNGQDVPVERRQEPRTVEFTALPGDYRLGIETDSKYLTFGDTRTARLRMDGSGYSEPLRFESATTPALESEVARQVEEKLDRCARATEFEPEGCPFGYTTLSGEDEDYRNPRWSITEYPAYTVNDFLDELTFATDTPGEVRLDYEYNAEWDEDEPADWEDRDTSTSLYVTGDVAVSGDGVTVSLDSD